MLADRPRFTIALLVAAALAPATARAQPLPPPTGTAPPPATTAPAPPAPPVSVAPPAQPAPPVQPPPPAVGAQPPPPGVVAPQPPPPGPPGWPQPYPPPGPMWGPPILPPPDPPAREVGVTARGIPFGQRGGVILDSATVSTPERSGASVVLVGSLPLVGMTYFDARVPIAIGEAVTPGNPTLAIRSMVRASKSFWFLAGGGVGLPVLQRGPDEPYEFASASRAFWDLQEFFPEILPFMVRLGVEGHAGDLVILRAQLEPALFVAVRENDETELVIQHAAEIQVGHTIGAGLRIQGVATPTFEEIGTRHITEEDLYQFAMEPFFVVERDLAFLRAGLLLPFDRKLGPPLTTTWAARFALGLRVD